MHAHKIPPPPVINDHSLKRRMKTGTGSSESEREWYKERAHGTKAAAGSQLSSPGRGMGL